MWWDGGYTRVSVSSVDKKIGYKMGYWLLYFVLLVIMCLLLLIVIAINCYWCKNNNQWHNI